MLAIKWRDDSGQGEVCPVSECAITPDMVEEMTRAAIDFVSRLPKVSTVFFIVSKTPEVMAHQRKVLKDNKKPGAADHEPYKAYGWIEVSAKSQLSNVIVRFLQEKDRVESAAPFSTFMVQDKESLMVRVLRG